MKTKKSLNKRIFTYLGVSSAIFVLLYSMVIASYFIMGLSLNNEVILANEAKHYALSYQQDKNAPIPQRSFLKAYRNYDAVPESLRLLFPLAQRQHNDMSIIDTSDFTNTPEIYSAIEKLKMLCHGKKCEIILFYSYQLAPGEWLYLAMGLAPDDFIEKQMDRALYLMLSIGGIFFITLMALTFALVKNISQPITQLAQWTQQLNVDNVHDDLPNLRFKELEIVANQLQCAFHRISQVLENEKRFLNNASHELRTPVAVLATNLALLEKLRVKDKDNETQDKVIERLIRAVENMKQLMQTVLWLSKDTQDTPEAQEVALDELIGQIVEENNYLVANKDVDVNSQLITVDAKVPAALCSIVMTNLIRNAYQYTHQGEIAIELTADFVRVTNRCTQEHQQSTLAVEEYGFGLGIELVKRASEKLAWRFESTDVSGGRRVTLYFNE